MADVGPLETAFRTLLLGHDAISEKRMMGGICFFHQGNMLGGIDRSPGGAERLMFRVGKVMENQSLLIPGTSPVILGSRRMGGMVFLQGADIGPVEVAQLADLAFDFVRKLPGK